MVLPGYSEARATEHLKEAEIELRVDVGVGDGAATVCDLTHGDRRRLKSEGRRELPYIQRFRDAIVVVKFGGNAMVDPALAQTFAEDVVLAPLGRFAARGRARRRSPDRSVGLLGRLGKQTEFIDGLRVTDAETLDVARISSSARWAATSLARSTSTVRMPLACPARMGASSLGRREAMTWAMSAMS